MFIEWDFLLTEIWVLLVLAGLVGLFAGWLIWGGRSDLTSQIGPDADEVRRLRGELDRAKAQTRASFADPLDDVPAMQGGGYARPSQTAPPKPSQAAAPIATSEPVEQAPVREPVPAPVPPVAPESTQVRTAKPESFSAARDGLPDDLTKIKGIGGKMEKLCNRLGFWHYDQIAAWSGDEIAWVDDNLEGFKGRVSRDNWVEQAKGLAGNQTPAFVRRKD